MKLTKTTYYPLLCCCLLLIRPGFAQNLDSLRTVWEDETLADSTRIKAQLKRIDIGYFNKHPDTALAMMEECLEFAKARKVEAMYPTLYEYLGDVYLSRTESEKALAAYQMAGSLYPARHRKKIYLDIMILRIRYNAGAESEYVEKLNQLLAVASSRGFFREQILINAYLAKAYSSSGMYPEAIGYLRENLRIAEEQGYSKQWSKGDYLDLGYYLRRAGQLEESHETLMKCKELAEQDDDLYNLSFVYSNLGGLAAENRDYVASEGFYQKAIAIADSLSADLEKITFLSYFAESFHGRDSLLVEKLLQQSLDLSIQHGMRDFQAKSCVDMGEIQLGRSDYKKAKELCQTAYGIAKEMRLYETFRDACACLHLAHKGLGNDSEALWALEQNAAIKDTLFNKEQAQAITKASMEFIFEQEQAKEAALHQAELDREALAKKRLAAGLGVLGLLAALILWGYRNKQKANHLLRLKNQQIEEQRKQLEKLNLTKDRIFSILGHDMRKPAIAFRGIAKKVNYLLGKQDYARLEKLGDAIEKDALHLSTLTDNLLNWALTQKDALNVQLEDLQLKEIVDKAIQNLGRLAENKEIRIYSEIGGNVEVVADANSLLTIFRNLLDNAIKFTPAGGTIHLTAENAGTRVNISIADSGLGIAQEKLPYLFLLQKDKSTKGTDGEEGTGLGLHLVHELVKLNQGQIQVESQISQGTTFRITLKRA